jgi:hypothetical protein
MTGWYGQNDFYISVLELHDDIQQLSAEQVRGFSGWRAGARSLRIPSALHQGGGDIDIKGTVARDQCRALLFLWKITFYIVPMKVQRVARNQLYFICFN